MTPKDPPKHLRLLRPFAALALVVGAGGTTLGFVLLEKAQWLHGGYAFPWRQLHGELQVFGFLIPFVTGFGIYLVPRLAGGRPILHPRLARASLVAQAAGIVLVVAAALLREGAILRRAAAVALTVGIICAAVALRSSVRAHAEVIGGRHRVGYLWMLEVALWLLSAAAVSNGVALWLPGAQWYGLLDPAWSQAAWRLGVEGFGVGMALAVSARMFTGFLGIDPARAYPSKQSSYARDRRDSIAFWIALSAWALSVPLGAVPISAPFGDVLFALGVIPLSLRLGLAPIKKELSIDRTQDPVFPFGARATYGMLSLAALIGLATAVAHWSGAEVSAVWSDARRHLITIGFLLGLIALMAGRLAPGYSGRHLWGPRLRVVALAGFVSSGALRAVEAIAAQWNVPGLYSVSAASGVIALAAFAALLLALGVTLATARTAH